MCSYPGQEAENRARDTKIPSVLFYDEDGEVRAVGAEAVSDGTELEALDNGWIRAEWYIPYWHYTLTTLEITVSAFTGSNSAFAPTGCRQKARNCQRFVSTSLSFRSLLIT